MSTTRRGVLALAGSVLSTSTLGSLAAGCGTLAGRGGQAPRPALLAPLTGPAAAIGRSMANAAALAYGRQGANELMVIDSLGTPAGAGAAARRAVAAGAPVILGPLFGAEVPAVLAAAGRTPVVTLTNDREAGAGAFVLGVTPSQSVLAILSYARSRGVRAVTIVAGPDSWSRQASASAVGTSESGGLRLDSVGRTAAEASPEALRARNGGELPDAVLLADSDPASVAVAAALNDAGVQLLGTSHWAEQVPVNFAELEGMWLAAPEQASFGDFAAAYQARFGASPGIIAGLAYDAAAIARTAAANSAREALARAQGFAGVVGHVRFGADGTCTRRMSIVVVEAAGLRTVQEVEGR